MDLTKRFSLLFLLFVNVMSAISAEDDGRSLENNLSGKNLRVVVPNVMRIIFKSR